LAPLAGGFSLANDVEQTAKTIRKLVLSLKDIASVLRKADPRLKAEVYKELGVRDTYDPHRRVISVSEARTVRWIQV
jgi:hypothetical protein